jgi:hypothetical protein
MTRRAAALGIDIDGVVKSEAEVQREQQEQQQLAMAQHLGPNAINQIGENQRAAQAEAPTTGG